MMQSEEPGWDLTPFENLDHLPGPQALAIAMQNALTARGFPPHTLASILLEPVDHAQILADWDVVVETDPRSELRANMANNPLFKHMAWLLRNLQSVLSNLIKHINEEWARYIQDFTFKDDALVFNVIFPNGETADLSNDEIDLLVKVLKVHGVILDAEENQLEDGL